MMTGTVKWFDTTRGYGFIRPSDGGRDVFVHISAVQAAGLTTLNENQKVSYELKTERGKTTFECLASLAATYAQRGLDLVSSFVSLATLR